MKPKTPPWWQQIKVLKDWWWAIGLIVGAAILWGNLPKRVDKLEAGQAEQAEDIVDLKGIAKKIEGYTEAMNQQITQQRQQPVVPRPPSTPLTSRALPEWVEQDDSGCWRCFAKTLEECWLDDSTTELVDNFWKRCSD